MAVWRPFTAKDGKKRIKVLTHIIRSLIERSSFIINERRFLWLVFDRFHSVLFAANFIISCLSFAPSWETRGVDVVVGNVWCGAMMNALIRVNESLKIY